MRWKILFAAVLWSQIGHAVPERCETLLEAKSVQAAAANLLDKKLSRKAVLGLRGHYDSMSRAEQTQLRKMFTTKPKPGAAEMWVESITMKQNEAVVDIRIAGIGKNVLRSLLDLNARSAIKRASSWKAWQISLPSVDKPVLHPPAPISEEEMRERFLLPLNALDFSVRTRNCLRNENLMFVGDLVHRSRGELLRIANFGGRSLREVEEQLNGLGLSLEMDPGGWPPEEIPPVLRQVAMESRPTFEISDWTAIDLGDAEEYVEILRRLWPYNFVMSQGGVNLLAIFPKEKLNQDSLRDVLWSVNPLRSRSEVELGVSAEWIDHLRERLKDASTITLSQTLGSSGQEILRRAAEEEAPLRIEIWPGKSDYLILLPVARMFR